MRSLLFKILLPIVALIGIAYPFYGLCIYIGFNIIRPEMLFWGESSNNIIFKICFIATFIGYLRTRSNPKKLLSYPEFWLLFWIWVACVLSLLLSEYPLEPKAWYYCNELLKLWLLGCLILGICYKKEHVVKLEMILIGCMTFIAVWGVEQYFGGNPRLEGLGGDSWGDSNSVAAVGVLFFPVALNYAITANGYKKKLISLFSTIVIVAMIIFTQSRGGFLGLLFAYSSFVFFCPYNKKKLIVAGAVVCLLVSPFLAKTYIQRLETISFESHEADLSAGSRPVLWQAGLLMFIDHPIFGAGLLNFPQAKEQYKNQLSDKIDQELLEYSFRDYKVGHGFYFTQLMAEGGLLLTIPYTLLIGGFFIGAWRVRKKSYHDDDLQLIGLLAGVEAGIVGHCICIIFINALFLYFLPIQLLIGRQIVRNLEASSNDRLQGAL